MTTQYTLYYHRTDGGAEYLCASPVEGTDEGDLHTAVIRLDGGPEFLNPVYAAAPKLLKACQLLAAWDMSDGDTDLLSQACSYARVAIAKAEGE